MNSPSRALFTNAFFPNTLKTSRIKPGHDLLSPAFIFGTNLWSVIKLGIGDTK
jgi:hypothetical protein